MANEAVFKYGTAKVLTTAGGSAATTSLSAAAGTTYSQADTLDYPDAKFVLIGAASTFATAPTAGTTIDVYIRPKAINGGADAPAPTAGASNAYMGKYATSFVISTASASTSSQTYEAIAYDIPRAGEVYLYNNGTGATLNSNYTLTIIPRTLGPA